MKRQESKQLKQMDELVQFVEQHPRFAPELVSEGGMARGFYVGETFLTMCEMEELLHGTRDLAPASRGQSAARQDFQRQVRNEVTAARQDLQCEIPRLEEPRLKEIAMKPYSIRINAPVLGPFLTLIFTLGARKKPDRGFALRSSTIAAG